VRERERERKERIRTNVEHALGNERRKLSDLFIDVVSPPALNGIMGLSAPPALLTGNGSLLISWRLDNHRVLVVVMLLLLLLLVMMMMMCRKGRRKKRVRSKILVVAARDRKRKKVVGKVGRREGKIGGGRRVRRKEPVVRGCPDARRHPVLRRTRNHNRLCTRMRQSPTAATTTTTTTTAATAHTVGPPGGPCVVGRRARVGAGAGVRDGDVKDVVRRGQPDIVAEFELGCRKAAL